MWKNNAPIFLLAPWDFKLAHLLGHSDLVKIMAHFGQWQKLSDTSISSSLSLVDNTQVCNEWQNLLLD